MESKVKKQAKELAFKVAPIYKMLDWKWAGNNNTHLVPDAIDIYECLMELYKSMEENKVEYSSTGGLTVRKEEEGIVLSFSVEETVYQEEVVEECGYDTDEV